jgi:hypothetical protein
MDIQRTTDQSALARGVCGTKPDMCRPEYSMSASDGCVCLSSFASHPTSGAEPALLQVIGAVRLGAATATRQTK